MEQRTKKKLLKLVENYNREFEKNIVCDEYDGYIELIADSIFTSIFINDFMDFYSHFKFEYFFTTKRGHPVIHCF